MKNIWEEFYQKECIFQTRYGTFEEDMAHLKSILTKSQMDDLIDIIDEKDFLIAEAARSNYEKGFLDGIELLSAVCHRRWHEDE